MLVCALAVPGGISSFTTVRHLTVPHVPCARTGLVPLAADPPHVEDGLAQALPRWLAAAPARRRMLCRWG